LANVTIPFIVMFPLPTLSILSVMFTFIVHVTFPFTVTEPVPPLIKRPGTLLELLEIVPPKVIVPPTVTVLPLGALMKLPTADEVEVNVRLEVNEALPVVMMIPPFVVKALGMVIVLPAVMPTFNEPVPMLAGNSAPAVMSTVPS